MPTHKFSILNFQFSIKKGFTLIEILIVFTMIGIIAGMFLASYDKLQQKNRDTRRKQDLQNVKKALELAKLDSPGGAFYPSCKSTAKWAGAGFCYLSEIQDSSVPPQDLLLSPKYIDIIPADPKSKEQYLYAPYDYDASNTKKSCAPLLGSSLQCKHYIVIGCLENSSDPQKDESVHIFCTFLGAKASYTVESD